MKFYRNIMSILFICTFFIVDLCAVNPKDFAAYLDQIENVSRKKIPQRQRKILLSHATEYGEEILEGFDLDDKHAEFDSKKRSLIKKWIEKTGMAWPKYDEKTECTVDGTCLLKKTGWLYDAHHIIPQSYNGPNEWWNLTPLDTRQHNLIHGRSVKFSNRSPRKLPSAICCKLFPESCGIRE